MKESCGKGLASHPDPESCAGSCREAAIEYHAALEIL
jgi:hypothetical protein